LKTSIGNTGITRRGFEEIRKMWGDKASEAGLLHLVRDTFGSIDDKYFSLWKNENEVK